MRFLTQFILTSLLVSVACSPQPQKEVSESTQNIKPSQIQASPASAEDQALLAESKLHFEPLTGPQDLNPAQVKLGKMLFFETRLSKSGTLSCQQCHQLKAYGVDRLPLSIGHQGQKTQRNSPTVFNADLNLAQFWDGRAKDLVAQAKEPILNPQEMAMASEGEVIGILQKIPGYPQAFQQAFPDQSQPLTYQNLAQAIAAFERSLVTPARFDQFLTGDLSSLNPSEKKGLRTFINTGCIACHNGPGLGGGSFQKFGVTNPYEHQKDRGRIEVTQAKRDEYLFKVPILRNIAETAPYFHDGKVADLKEAVKIMGKTQLDRDYSEAELADLVAFLKSLTGPLPPEMVQVPELPK